MTFVCVSIRFISGTSKYEYKFVHESDFKSKINESKIRIEIDSPRAYVVGTSYHVEIS